MSGPSWYRDRLLRIALLVGCFGAAPESMKVFEQNFDRDKPGIYDRAAWRMDFPDSKWEEGVGDGRVEITANGSDNTHGLRVTYPAKTFGPDQGGAQWLIPFHGKTYDEATVEYRVLFEKGFEWKLGGKLPGLVGGEAVATGGHRADGANGWSARVMWRRDGTVAQYVYHVDQPTQYGEDLWWMLDGKKVVLKDDTWYTFKTHIVMNTPGKNDGVLQSWLDDKPVLDRHDIRWRDVATLKIDNLYFSTFYGGASPEWAPDATTHVRFDSFKVSVP